jgi:hypothetical protein
LWKTIEDGPSGKIFPVAAAEASERNKTDARNEAILRRRTDSVEVSDRPADVKTGRPGNV